MEFKWAYGCPFNCAWCYLKGTFRFHPAGPQPVIKNYDRIKAHLLRFFAAANKPELLNTGEIADSLMGETLNPPFSKFIIPLFEEQSKHKILFLTKAVNVKNLLEMDRHRQVIVSYSLNAEEVAQRWEKGAPAVSRRINAAKDLIKAGYQVRVRIDPMVPIANWETQYKNLLEQIFNFFTPSRITLGSLRGLPSTIARCTDKSWLEFLDENSNWGKKVRFQIRHEMYSSVIEELRYNHNYPDIGLCKETMEMWSALGMDYSQISCNCIL
jgi:spore photoproduct lyase